MCVPERRFYNDACTVACYLISRTLSTRTLYGFVRVKSCTSQLLSIFHQISQNLHSGKQTDILYLNIAKAFDTVDHKLLIKKLSQYGLSGNILNWFKRLPIWAISGVTQGSILGPLIFLLYKNDLPRSVSSPSVDASLFANDTKCFTIVNSLADTYVLKSEAGPKLGG